jgi:hypothetical protein
MAHLCSFWGRQIMLTRHNIIPRFVHTLHFVCKWLSWMINGGFIVWMQQSRIRANKWRFPAVCHYKIDELLYMLHLLVNASVIYVLYLACQRQTTVHSRTYTSLSHTHECALQHILENNQKIRPPMHRKNPDFDLPISIGSIYTDISRLWLDGVW